MLLRNTLLLFCSILFFSVVISPTANALPTTKKEWDKCVEKVSKRVNTGKVGTLGLDNAINKQCGRYSPVEETASMISGIGVSPNELVRSKKWKKKFMDITKDKYTDFVDSLLLESETTTLENGWIFGYGSKPHFVGTYDAAFAINVSSGDVFVAMNENNTISGFGFYSSWGNAPEPLKEWKSQLEEPTEETETTEVKTEEVDYFSLCTNGDAIACAKLCNSGYAGGCSKLGILYADGQGVKQDYFKAKEFYEKACNGGIAYSCVGLGILYELGKGVKQDYLKSFELYENAHACSLLASLYKKGQGVKQDYFKAFELNKESCDRGYLLGCTYLGSLYSDGKGIKQDYFKAKEFYEKACNGGESNGCGYLGIMYKYGEGVKQDHSKAKEFYGKACDLKDQLGCEAYAKLNK